MPTAAKTVTRVQLGRELRRLRETTGTTRDQVAGRLGWGMSKLSRIEGGGGTLAPTELEALAELFGLDAEEGEKLRRLGEQARKRHTYGKTPDWARTFVEWESDAAELLAYQAEVVPGLLQTPEYARAVIGASVVADPYDIDGMVADRARRQQRITPEMDLRLSVVLSEAVVRRFVGGAEVMRGQLAHLAEVSGYPGVTLQVLPFSSGAHAALGSSFVVLKLSDESQLDAVYLEDLTSADYIDRPRDVRTYRLVFQRLQVAALGEPETVSLLSRLQSELE